MSRYLEPDFSIGVTNSLDSKSPLLEPNLIQNANKNHDFFYVFFHKTKIKISYIEEEEKREDKTTMFNFTQSSSPITIFQQQKNAHCRYKKSSYFNPKS